MRVASVAMLVCAGVGCASGPAPSNTYNAIIDPKFSPAESALVVAAFDEWQNTANAVGGKGSLTFHISVGTCIEAKDTVCVIPSTRAILMGNGASVLCWGLTIIQPDPNAAIRSYIAVDQLVYLPDASDPAHPVVKGMPFEVSILHEIGHALGLKHTPDYMPGMNVGKTIMAPTWPDASHNLTCTDLGQFLNVRDRGFADCKEI